MKTKLASTPWTPGQGDPFQIFSSTGSLVCRVNSPRRELGYEPTKIETANSRAIVAVPELVAFLEDYLGGQTTEILVPRADVLLRKIQGRA